VSETDTIVRVTDGNIVAIGGLMSYDLRDNRGGLPGLSSVPLISNADRRNSKREMVILLKPTVLADDRAWAEDLRQTQERIRNLYPRKP
jgi:MSHA biogenesis protein MshL